MTVDESNMAAVLAERIGIDRTAANEWLDTYRAAPDQAQRMLEHWLETGEYPTDQLEGGHSVSSLAQSLPSLQVFDLIDVLLREPRVGLRMIARALNETPVGWTE